MIPIHDISETEKKEIRMNELVTLTHYDSSEAHRHQYFEFFVFLKGGGVHVIDFVEFPIESDSVHIVAPGQVHHVKRELNSNGFVFLFELNLFESSKYIEKFLFDHVCLDVSEFSPTYRFSEPVQQELRQLVGQSWKEYNSDQPFKNQLVMNQLSLMMIHCMRNKPENLNETDSRNNGVYIAFRRLLNQEYKNLKKVREYAAALNVTEKLLNDVIQQRTGESVSSLIYKQLILEAKRLLNTGIPAKEVSYELNFTDPAHFSKFFKTQTGFSPSEFRTIQG